MEKKLTKAQLKEIEEREEELRGKRRELVIAINNFWEDNSAASRYLSNRGEKLTEEEEEKNLRRYEALNDYKLNYDREDPEYSTWGTLRDIVIVEGKKANYDKTERYCLSIKILEDDFYMEDSNWNTNEIKLTIKLLRKYGYKRILYGNESTLGVPNLAWFIQYGAKVEGSFYNANSQRNGLILNIEECNIEGSDEKYLEEAKRRIKEYIKNVDELRRFNLRYEKGDLYNLVSDLNLNYIEIESIIENSFKEVKDEKDKELREALENQKENN